MVGCLPSPRSAPACAFDEYVLCSCATGSDAIDTSLHQLTCACRTHIMWFIVAIEDDFVVAFEKGCGCCPPCFETCVIRNDISVVTSEVVRIEDSIGSFRGNIIEVCNHGISVSCIDATSHCRGNKPLHHDGNTCVILVCFS